jgi:hypothetical protein
MRLDFAGQHLQEYIRLEHRYLVLGFESLKRLPLA